MSETSRLMGPGRIMTEEGSITSMRRDWEYAGQKLWTTVQLGEPDLEQNVDCKVVVTWDDKNKDSELVRVVGAKEQSTRADVKQLVNTAEQDMRNLLSSLERDANIAYLKISGFTPAVLPVDVTPFSEFKEFQ